MLISLLKTRERSIDFLGVMFLWAVHWEVAVDKTLNKPKDFRFSLFFFARQTDMWVRIKNLKKEGKNNIYLREILSFTVRRRYAVRSERLKSNLNDKISRHRGYDFVHRIPVSIMHIFVFNCKNLPRKYCPLVVSFFDVDRCGRVKLIMSWWTKLREHFQKP